MANLLIFTLPFSYLKSESIQLLKTITNSDNSVNNVTFIILKPNINLSKHVALKCHSALIVRT